MSEKIKLTISQRTEYHLGLARFIALGGRVFFSRTAGAMVALMPESNGNVLDDYRVCRIYTALCHTNDTFQKKLGFLKIMKDYEGFNGVYLRVYSKGLTKSTAIEDSAYCFLDYFSGVAAPMEDFEELTL